MFGISEASFVSASLNRIFPSGIILTLGIIQASLILPRLIGLFSVTRFAAAVARCPVLHFGTDFHTGFTDGDGVQVFASGYKRL